MKVMELIPNPRVRLYLESAGSLGADDEMRAVACETSRLVFGGNGPDLTISVLYRDGPCWHHYLEVEADTAEGVVCDDGIIAIKLPRNSPKNPKSLVHELVESSMVLNRMRTKKVGGRSVDEYMEDEEIVQAYTEEIYPRICSGLLGSSRDLNSLHRKR
ncbi:MAG: hypothetical protein WAV41_02275 [Microgenomates group bacterium]